MEEKLMRKSIKPRRCTLKYLAAWILMIGLLAGCAASPERRANSGILKLSREVSQIFESYQVLPQYKYYYFGSDTKPSAIMGIDRNYTLDTELWKEAADLTPEQLKKWVEQILAFLPPVRTYGAYILGPAGEQVGIWYSPYPDAPVSVQPDKRVEIIPHTNFPNAARQ
jgi:hypothetical protein